MSEQTEGRITAAQTKVRQVTAWQATWADESPGVPGTFTLQLILDEGAEEYVLRPIADDVDVLQELFADAATSVSVWSARCSWFGARGVESRIGNSLARDVSEDGARCVVLERKGAIRHRSGRRQRDVASTHSLHLASTGPLRSSQEKGLTRPHACCSEL